MNKRLLLTLSVSALCTSAALAIPAKPGLREVTQPDGSILTISVVGDERSHRTYTADGILLFEDEVLGYTYATVGEDGLPASSGIAAFDMGTRAATGISGKIASIDQAKVAAAFDLRDSMRNAERNIARGSVRKAPSADRNVGLCDVGFPLKGSPKGLVVLVQYTDVEFSTEDPLDYFSRMCNEPGFSDLNATGSARDWYIANSNGQFTPDFDVYGPITLAGKRVYYGGNDPYGEDRHAGDMAIEACRQLDDTVDFTQYDTDGDGVIDNIFIFFAGQGEANGGPQSSVWPHFFYITEYDPLNTYTFDGVKLDRYACSSELTDTDHELNVLDGIGTFVHEFSHVMGLPDLYTTNYSGAFTPGEWSVLDMGSYNNDGRTPPNYSAYERYALGWLEPVVLNSPGQYSLEAVQTENEAFIIPTEYEDEFFILENRQQIDNDTYLPGHGMLVWHVDFNKRVWEDNIVNVNPAHQYVDLLEADNMLTSSTRDGDSFPGVSEVVSLSPETVPGLVDWNRQDVKMWIDNITESEDGVISFYASPSAGISNTVASSGIRVWNAGMTLYTDSESIVTVYDIAGRHIADISASSPATLPSAGLYIASTPEKGAVKITVE